MQVTFLKWVSGGWRWKLIITFVSLSIQTESMWIRLKWKTSFSSYEIKFWRQGGSFCSISHWCGDVELSDWIQQLSLWITDPDITDIIKCEVWMYGFGVDIQ